MAEQKKVDNGAGSGLQMLDNAPSQSDPEQIPPPPPAATLQSDSAQTLASSDPPAETLKSHSARSLASSGTMMVQLPIATRSSRSVQPVKPKNAETQELSKKHSTLVHDLAKEIPKLIEEAVVKENNQDIKRMLKATMRTEQQVPRSSLIDYLEREVVNNDKCFEFPFVFCKFLFFALMVLSHEEISQVSQIERNFRGFSEGTGFEGYVPFNPLQDATSGHKTLDDIDCVSDIYTFLQDAFLPLFIPPLGTDDPYRSIRYNQLIGGVKISQLRREEKNCGEEYPNQGPFDDKGSNPFLDFFSCFPQSTYSKECFGLGLTNAQAAKRGWCNDIVYKQRRLRSNDNATAKLRIEDVMRPSSKVNSNFEEADSTWAVDLSSPSSLGAALSGYKLADIEEDQHTKQFLDEEDDLLLRHGHPRRHKRKRTRRRLNAKELPARRLDFSKAAAKSKLGNQKATAGFFGVDYAEYFTMFMHESEGLAAAHAKLKHMADNEWIDLQTYVLNIGVFLFNPDLGVFMSGNVMIYLLPSGMQIPYVQVTAFMSEPYGAVQIIVFEILWFCFYLHLLGCVLYRFCKACASKKTFKAWVESLWTYVEALTALGGGIIIIFWVIYYGRLADVKEKALAVNLNRPPPGMSADTDEYLRSVASLHQEIGFLTGFAELYRVGISYYFLLVGLRFFKAFQAQPRLAIITDTLIGCIVDIVHFFIVFMTMFMAFVLSAQFIFGHRMAEFATTYLAIEKCFMMLLGEFDFDDVADENPLIAALWFHTYLILMTLLMMNMCLAIIMDTYSAAKSNSDLKEAIWKQLQNMWEDLLASRRGKISTKDVLKVLKMIDLDLVSKNVLLEAIPTMRKAQAQELIDTIERVESADDEENLSNADAIKLIASTKVQVKKIAHGIDEYVILNRNMRDSLTGGHLYSDHASNKKRQESMNARLDRTSSARIKQLETRLVKIEDFLNEVMCYFVVRGKETRNRLQALEEFLRGQRDAAVHITQDMWDDAPKLQGYSSQARAYAPAQSMQSGMASGMSSMNGTRLMDRPLGPPVPDNPTGSERHYFSA